MTAMGRNSFAYDVNGNMVSASSPARPSTLIYDAENRPRSVNGDGINEDSVYDDGGQRVKQVSNGVVTKYYFFAGQRIAMKRNGVLTYLHSDHLGSTVLETNTSGQIVSDQRYYAYGRQRDTGPVNTDHRFTGQKQDASGLVYMNARYYDPVLGQFISPDSLVPDAGVLMDYNRYGYARGNPMRFNDPSGHCATLSSGEADENDDDCWRLANTIANMWDDTDYWQTRFGDVGVWNDLIAPSGATAEFFAGELEQYAVSDEYKTWSAKQDVSSIVVDPWYSDPVLLALNAYCSAHDCDGMMLDVIGGGAAAATAIACIPGFAVCGSVMLVGSGIGISTGGIGVARTAAKTIHGDVSEVDLVVSTTTFAIGTARIANPVVGSIVGLGASVFQLIWDHSSSRTESD